MSGEPTPSARGGGADVGLIEVLEAVDDPDDQREEDHRREHGQGHVAEPLPGVGALDRDRLVQVTGHVQQAGQVQHDRIADPPQPQDQQGRLRPGGIEEPERLVEAEVAEELVDRAGGRVEQVDEHQRGAHGGRHRRHEEQRPVAVDAALGAGQQHRRGDAEEDPQRHAEDDDPQRVLDRRPEERVALVGLAVQRQLAEHEPVVVEPDPVRRGQQVVVRERVVEAQHHRPHRERDEADDPRRQEQQHRQVLAQRRPTPRTPAFCRRAPRVGRRAGGGQRYGAVP